MNQQTPQQPAAQPGQQSSVRSKAGERFYSWQTISSLVGCTAAVTLIWNVLSNVGGEIFANNIALLGISFVVVAALSIFTEPPKGVTTTWRQKGQKTLQTVINSFLVYSTALGAGTTFGTTVPS